MAGGRGQPISPPAVPHPLCSLIDKWFPITLEVALELLDHHFADEKVRALAVHRLELLGNDELQCFLLQMIQVGGACKVT